jgi:antirestriction protein
MNISSVVSLKCFALLGLLIISCKKVPNELQHVKGSYEWSFSHLVSYGGQAVSTYITSVDKTDKYAIVIEKRRIYFYKNGEKEYSCGIRSISQHYYGFVSIEYRHDKEKLWLTVDGNELTSSYPFPSTSSSNTSSNYFIKK